MRNCTYKIKLGNEIFEFNSDEELNSFINNNYNRLKIYESLSKYDGLAPNGKASNLTEELWYKVRTKEFKSWLS